MKAQPGPRLSGRYFAPKAPLLWMKRIPAVWVMSVKWMPAEGVCADAERIASMAVKITTEARSHGETRGGLVAATASKLKVLMGKERKVILRLGPGSIVRDLFPFEASFAGLPFAWKPRAFWA